MSAADYGFVTPSGNDLISAGDNAITTNAEKTAEWLERVRYVRDGVPTTDANDFRAAGIYRLGAPFPDGYTNFPENVTGPSILQVGIVPPFTWGFQLLFQIGASPRAWWRASIGATTWGTWNPLGSDRGEIPTGTNVDLMRGNEWGGPWNISNATTGNSLTGTFPPDSGTKWLPGQLQVLGTGGGAANLSSQIYTPYTAGVRDPEVYFRTIGSYSETGAAAWTRWIKLGSGGGSGPSDIPVNALALGGRDVRMQLFKDDYPLVSTGGKGAVVFRYDHGLTNFKDVLLPLHEQHGIPAYIAMNSRNWSLAENSGATQTEARSWPNIEWGNHTSDHQDKTGIDDVWDTIVNGRLELEDQLGTVIHGFTVPGLPGSGGPSYDKLDGFGVGYAAGYSDSYAGSLILAHHAIASGVIGPQQRPLDGQIRIGGRHIGWESSTFATIKAHIDDAITNKTALTLMMHPRTMGLSGYWTPELAAQVISYVKDQIDAGNLANISYYQSHHATTEPLPIDTGWRDMSGQLLTSWTGGDIFIRRVNDEVLIVFKALDGTNATGPAPIQLPAGFGPDTFTGGSQAFYVRGDTEDMWGSAGNGFLRLAAGFKTRTGTWASIRFPAEATQPDLTNLPGTPRTN